MTVGTFGHFLWKERLVLIENYGSFLVDQAIAIRLDHC